MANKFVSPNPGEFWTSYWEDIKSPVGYSARPVYVYDVQGDNALCVYVTSKPARNNSRKDSKGKSYNIYPGEIELRDYNKYGFAKPSVVRCSRLESKPFSAFGKKISSASPKLKKLLDTTIEDSIKQLVNRGTYDKEYLTMLKEDLNLDEEIRINDTLNPALWNEDGELKEDVKEKLLDIADNFLDNLKEDKINIEVVDIRLLGSNANYNYTDQSDIDLHIVADVDSLPCEQHVLNQLYNAYKSIFNSKYDIKVKGHDVEIYVEDVKEPAKSNGVYSLYTGWVKKPQRQEVPDIDYVKFNKEFEDLEDDYFDLLDDLEAQGIGAMEYPMDESLKEELEDDKVGYRVTLEDYSGKNYGGMFTAINKEILSDSDFMHDNYDTWSEINYQLDTLQQWHSIPQLDRGKKYKFAFTKEFMNNLKSTFGKLNKALNSIEYRLKIEEIDLGSKDIIYDDNDQVAWEESLKEDLELSNEYDSEGNQLTKDQAEFFKNSKVRDNQGRLLVCYHGTSSDFTSFDKDLIGTASGDGGYYGYGFYFTTSKVNAKSYAQMYSDDNNPANVLEVYLNIKKMLVIPKRTKELIDMFRALGIELSQEALDRLNEDEEVWSGIFYEILDIIYDNSKSSPSEMFTQVVKQKGYDGIFAQDGKEIIVFDSNQIKSITNKQPTKSDNINEDLDDLSSHYDSLVEQELDMLNNFLEDFGFEVELIEDDEEDSYLDGFEDACGVYLADIQDSADIFPVILNKECILKECEDFNDLKYGIRGTLAHEAGHGIFRYLNDIIDLSDLDEEQTVEEFAIDYMDGLITSNDLYKMLMDYQRGEYDELDEDYDYGTGDVEGNDIFDTTTTGCGGYWEDLIKGRDIDYYKDKKNIVGEIVYMTPNEYYKRCAQMFRDTKHSNTDVSKLKSQREVDEKTLTYLKSVILDKKKKFPTPVLDLGYYPGQEGLHRAYVAGELFGWDTYKMPVLVIKIYNEKKYKEQKHNRYQGEFEEAVDRALKQSLSYLYNDKSEFWEEFYTQMKRLGYEEENLSLVSDEESVEASYYDEDTDDNYIYSFPKPEPKLWDDEQGEPKDEEEVNSDDALDILDIEDLI